MGKEETSKTGSKAVIAAEMKPNSLKAQSCASELEQRYNRGSQRGTANLNVALETTR
jgi:hypothetical protein